MRKTVVSTFFSLRMSKIAGISGMEKNTPRSSKNKFTGRNFTYKSRQFKFEGQIDALKGHIYDCTDNRQVDLYTTTTKEIAGYVAIIKKWE